MTTTHPTASIGIDHEPTAVSNSHRVARVAGVALTLILVVAGALAMVAAVPALVVPLLLFVWVGLLAAVVAGLVFGVEAVGSSL